MDEARHRHLSLESLEPRLQLASGVVSAVLVDGDMVVKGDAARNSIEIRPVLDPYGHYAGTLELTGENGTSVNYRGRTRALFEDFQGDIRISMPRGGYQIRIAQTIGNTGPPIVLPGDVKLYLGGERDGLENHVTFLGADVAGDVFVKTYRGDNYVDFEFSEFAGNVNVHTGRGRDTVMFYGSEVTGNVNVIGVLDKGPVPKKITHKDKIDFLSGEVGGDVKIKAIPGSHTRNRIISTPVGGDFTFIGGPGRDEIRVSEPVGGQVRVNTGRGADELAFYEATMDSVFANLGAGNDTVEITRSTVEQDATISMARGKDNIKVDDLTVGGHFQLNTGPSRDVVRLGTGSADKGITAGSASIVTGAGHDWLGLKKGQFAGDSLIQTGAGNDRISIVDTQWDGEYRLESGTGDDVIDWLDNRVTGNVAIMMANRGNDRVTANGNTVSGDLAIYLGAGRDSLFAESNTMAGITVWNGGTGFDTIDESDNTFRDLPLIDFFEDVK